jgi:hypothetical protein
MKACWDNINKMKYYQKKGRWTMNRRSYLLSESCTVCGDPFFHLVYNTGKYCSKSCSSNEKNNGMFGKHHTEEFKQFIGKCHKGMKHTKETRKKMSKSQTGKNNGMFGKHHTEESKQKISKNHHGLRGKKHPFYGKHHTEESKLKTSISMKKHLENPENHPNWKGGVSFLPYCIDWTKEYKEIIKHRDGYKCSNFLCYNSPDENDLTIHHIDYNKLNCSMDNLITVCRSCNGKANKDREWHTSFYTELLKGRYNHG